MLIYKIKESQLQARKNREKEKSFSLTYLIGECEKVTKKEGRDIYDAEVISKIKKLVSSLKENLMIRPSEDAESEIHLYESFLPLQMSKEEVTKIIESFISQLEDPSMRDMRIIMTNMEEKYSGLYDSKFASGIAKSLLM